jgi:hypothetical protein
MLFGLRMYGAILGSVRASEDADALISGVVGSVQDMTPS